jgi:hypothetical protein
MNLQKADQDYGVKPKGSFMEERKAQKNKMKGGEIAAPTDVSADDWAQAKLKQKLLNAMNTAASQPRTANVPMPEQSTVMPKVKRAVEKQPQEDVGFNKLLTHMSSGRYDKANEIIQQKEAKHGMADYKDALFNAWQKNDINEVKRLMGEHQSKYYPDAPEPKTQQALESDLPKTWSVRNKKAVGEVDPAQMVERIATQKLKELEREDSLKVPGASAPQKPRVKNTTGIPDPEQTWKNYGEKVLGTLRAYGNDPQKVKDFYIKANQKGHKRFMNQEVPPLETIDYLLNRASKEKI